MHPFLPFSDFPDGLNVLVYNFCNCLFSFLGIDWDDMKRTLLTALFATLFFSFNAFPGIVINELYYNPPDGFLEAGEHREFVELFNPDASRVNVSGYYFDTGITFTIPEGTWIEAGSYLVLVKNTSPTYWRNKPFRIVGPYEGVLADGGERITFKRPDGTIVESFKYDDEKPWPRAADGYNSSLERIAWNLPPEDYHSWRSSLQAGGTPGEKNSVDGVPPYPLIREYSITPQNPTSADEVMYRITLDAPDQVHSVALRYEFINDQPIPSGLVRADSEWRYWKGRSAPSTGLEWTKFNFDDSAWLKGKGGFGYGDLDRVETVLSDMQRNYSTLYIRQKFQVDDPSAVGALSLYIYFDDGFICYINGEEVARENAPQPYTHTSLANGGLESDTPYVYALAPKNGLQVGENVIALVGFNVSLAGSSDFVLTPSLVSERDAVSSQNNIPMRAIQKTDQEVVYEAKIRKSTSQNLVRANIRVELTNGKTIVLPPEIEPNPFLSYFIYDGEIESKLPIFWILPSKKSILLTLNRAIGCVICQPLHENHPTVFDGAILLPSASSRTKIRFIKGEEFYGDRTINIIPEVPTGGTNAGISSPYREHLGFWFFAEMGVPSPWSEFYRIIELPSNPNAPHTQQLVNQQVNEKFLEMNGLNPDADLYKLVYSNPNWEKHTNLLEGTGSIQELLSAITVRDLKMRRTAMEERLNLEEFLAYSAASIYTSNWDGYWNNNWMYLDPDTKKWTIIPWDLDWIWGATPPPNTGPMYWKMPLDFPIDGVAVGDTRVSRAPGPVTSPMHQEPVFFEDYLKILRKEFNRCFSQQKLFTKMDEMQEMLLSDLDLIQHQTGRNVSQRKTQINESYDTLKLYVERRRAFLDPLLPVPVSDWPIY